MAGTAVTSPAHRRRGAPSSRNRGTASPRRLRLHIRAPAYDRRSRSPARASTRRTAAARNRRAVTRIAADCLFASAAPSAADARRAAPRAWADAVALYDAEDADSAGIPPSNATRCSRSRLCPPTDSAPTRVRDSLAGASVPAYNRSVKRDLNKRIMALPFRAKLTFAWRIFRDPGTPLPAKAVMPAVLAYLAMPLDIIPDFIPVLGQLDDLLVVALGLGLVLLMTPRHVIEAHLGELE
jgi:uncharacterized membrane protein YkvA (DUF1232 family)